VNDPIVVVGAGHAAVRAALSLRDAGYKGTVVMMAAEGVEQPYERPPLSKWSTDETFDVKPLVSEAELRSANIERITSKVVSLDSSNKLVHLGNGDIWRYSKLLLATGATARKLPDSLSSGSNVFYLRDIADALALQRAAQEAKSAVIIGGGFIGLELAASLRSIGKEVHVVDSAERVLGRAVSASVAGLVHDLHVKQGVRFILNSQLEEITASPAVVRLHGAQSLHADMVVAGIGSVPEVLLAQRAGLEVSNGIVVDSYLRTSDPDIFAAGDCCAFPLYGAGGRSKRLESWQAAGDQGAVAAKNMIDDNSVSYKNVPWFWSEQYDHVLQVAGLPSQGMQFFERSYSETHHVSFGINPDGTLGYACGIAAGLKVAKDIRFSMKLIENKVVVASDDLGNPGFALKGLL